MTDTIPALKAQLAEQDRQLASLRARNATLGRLRVDLEGQRQAVLALHRPEAYGADGLCCSACIGAHEDPVPWPCATATALGVTP